MNDLLWLMIMEEDERIEAANELFLEAANELDRES